MSSAHLDQAEVSRRLPFPALIAGLRAAFSRPAEDAPLAPVRQRVDFPGGSGREMLLMPALTDSFAGVKMLTIVPDNPARNGLPVIGGVYALFDFRNGRPLATLDADELTGRRTAAVSALAADRLARKDVRRLLILGAGHLVPYMAEAHLAVRDYESVTVWARDAGKAATVVARIITRLGGVGNGSVVVQVARGSLEEEISAADVVSAVTRATEPLIKGQWLRPGTHVDLVGCYRPDMREADEETFKTGRVFVDTRDGVLAEAGDVLVPLRAGVIDESAILGDMRDLATGRAARRSDDEITVFKAVGTAAADLISAETAWKS